MYKSKSKSMLRRLSVLVASLLVAFVSFAPLNNKGTIAELPNEKAETTEVAWFWTLMQLRFGTTHFKGTFSSREII